MKYLLVILLAISGCAELGFTKAQIEQSEDHYSFSKIDSVGNYYVIYAKKQDLWYKIVSKKVSNINCEKVKVGRTYTISLTSLLEIKGKSIIAQNQINEISGWRLDNSTLITFEGDSIRNLYSSDNLNGLCLKNK